MNIYKVSQLTSQLSKLINENKQFTALAVEGEVSNFKLNASGHIYFSLKDENAKINCVMFRSDVMNIDFIPKDGMYITVWGRVGFYEKTSVCQIYASVLINSGQGALWAKFTKLKAELEQKGYFSAERKKRIPLFSKKIAVITSPTGAVIHDIVTTLRRRNPAAEIILVPSAVQGSGAAEEISASLDYINLHVAADVVIIARGGGSIEELWPFNEPLLAESIYNSHIPVISAVGHETDFTISDFVADCRAATPTAAAEIASAPLADIKNAVYENQKFILNYIYRMIDNYRIRLAAIKSSPHLAKTPQSIVLSYRQSLKSCQARMYVYALNQLRLNKVKLLSLKARIENLDVKQTLKKGYALAYNNGKLIKNISDAAACDDIKIKFFNFSVSAKVTGIKGDKNGE